MERRQSTMSRLVAWNNCNKDTKQGGPVTTDWQLRWQNPAWSILFPYCKSNNTAMIVLISNTKISVETSSGWCGFRSLLILNISVFRNNLTVLDGIVVQGQGARGEFTLNGKRPGAHSTLLFEIKPSQLVDCHSESLCSLKSPFHLPRVAKCK